MKKARCYFFAVMIILSIFLGVFQIAIAQSNQSLSINPNSGPVGTIINAKAEGFNSLMVNFSFAGKFVTWAFQVTSGVNVEFAVPNVAPGVYTVTAYDNFGGYAETKFTVIVRVPNAFDTAWQQKYGDRDIESISNVIQTNDGGFAFLDHGWAHQFTFVPATFYKVNSSGGLEWTKSLGLFSGGSLVQTSDEGYAILGKWSTYGTSYENTHTLIKINSAGNVQWVKNYSSNIGTDLLLTNDGGFAMLKGNPNLDFPPNNHYGGNLTATLTKTDSYGKIQWTKNYTKPAIYNTITQVAQTNDQGFIMVGTTSFNGTSDTPNLYIWALKTDNQGKLQWDRLFGEGPKEVIANETENAGALDGINRRTSGDNEGVSVVQTSDGGYVITGIIFPMRDYSWWGFSYGSTPNTAKTSLIKIDAKGNAMWNHTYDGYEISPIIQTSDNGLAFATSLGIIKTDENGTLIWNKDDVTFPSLGIRPYLLGVTSIIETLDGSLAGIGVGTLSQSWQGNIYLFKTEPFLLPLSYTPLPTPLPTSFEIPLSSTPASMAAIAIVVLLLAIVSLLFFRRHRKTIT